MRRLSFVDPTQIMECLRPELEKKYGKGSVFWSIEYQASSGRYEAEFWIDSPPYGEIVIPVTMRTLEGLVPAILVAVINHSHRELNWDRDLPRKAGEK